MTTRETEIDILRNAATREQVRQAGFEPDTMSGQKLVEWANQQDRVPSVRDFARKATEENLPVQPVTDPTVDLEEQIREARAAGDWKTASQLQYRIDQERQKAEAGLPTDDEKVAIDLARSRAEQARSLVDTAEERAQARIDDEIRRGELVEDDPRNVDLLDSYTRQERQKAWAEASRHEQETARLRQQAERRMKGFPEDGPELYPVQPTGIRGSGGDNSGGDGGGADSGDGDAA